MQDAIKIFAISIFFCVVIKGQVVTERDFRNAKWATIDKDSTFFKSDTIKLVRMGEIPPYRESDAVNAVSYFQHNDFITIEFKKNHHFKLSKHLIEAWVSWTWNGKCKWKFEKSKQTLLLFLNKKLLVSFKALSVKEVEMEGYFTYQPSQKAKEIYFRRKS